MKCFYYLSPTLDISKKVSEDLQQAGLDGWYLHVISNDEAGLVQQHINSSNYLETLDLFRGTTVGGMIAFTLSLIASILATKYEPFGQEVSTIYYVIFIFVVTLFGIWEGGLYGISSDHQKIKPFREEIKKGKYLVLVYAEKEQEEAITSMMSSKHSESQLVAVDKHYINPFSKLKVSLSKPYKNA